MEYLRSKDQVVAIKSGSIHETVFKMGDLYKVKTTIDIPKSLINAFVSKAKKENGTDPKENWSDVDLAEMFVSYVTATFMNIESLPVSAILGEKTTTVVTATIQPEEVVQTLPVQGVVAQPAQPAADVVEPVQALVGEPTAEIQI